MLLGREFDGCTPSWIVRGEAAFAAHFARVLEPLRQTLVVAYIK